MKFESILSRIALVGVLAVIAGVALNALPLALFAAAVAVLVLLMAAADYGSRSAYAAALAPARLRRREVLPLAV